MPASVQDATPRGTPPGRGLSGLRFFQDATLGHGQAAVEAGLRLERLETCLSATAYDGLHFPDPPAVRTSNPAVQACLQVRPVSLDCITSAWASCPVA